MTRVADFTHKMLGTANDPKLKTKGAETWGVALFLIDELQERSNVLGDDADRLIQAGKSLQAIVELWKSNGWIMPTAAAEENRNILQSNHFDFVVAKLRSHLICKPYIYSREEY